MHDPADLGQSLRSYIQGDEGLFGDASEPLQIRAYADPRVLAEHCRDAVWEDGAHFLKANPGGALGGASGTNPAGDRGDQRRPGGSPLEEVRGARGRARYGYSLLKRYTSRWPARIAKCSIHVESFLGFRPPHSAMPRRARWPDSNPRTRTGPISSSASPTTNPGCTRPQDWSLTRR